MLGREADLMEIDAREVDAEDAGLGRTTPLRAPPPKRLEQRLRHLRGEGAQLALHHQRLQPRQVRPLARGSCPPTASRTLDTL